MSLRARAVVCFLAACLLGTALCPAQQAPGGGSSSRARSASHPKAAPSIAGSVSDNVYHNPYFGFSCKIPLGWVLRTEEMNARPEDSAALERSGLDREQQSRSHAPEKSSEAQRTQSSTKEGGPQSDANSAGKRGDDGRVLLAAFSRPPEAVGAEVNSSIVIAAESAASYPGLKSAPQYFGPLAEVTAAQGFKVVNEPYEFSVGGRQLVRGDFSKALGSAAGTTEQSGDQANPANTPPNSSNAPKTIHQATLVILARGYAVSFTFVAGSDDDVEELVGSLSFGTTGNSPAKK